MGMGLFLNLASRIMQVFLKYIPELNRIERLRIFDDV